MGADIASEEQFGPYLVYERLGVGGMATVHRALERGVEGFERVVALKRLLPHLAEDASFIKAFVREAKLASMLAHVNIVQIYELGRVGTEYFISMEYIEGRDIRRILRHARKVTGPAPIHVTVGLMLQLCEALDYAHTKSDDDGSPLGLVHRDVSPSNLLVTKTGHLKVIDFGIARAQSSQLRTQTGRVKGKLAYMAPEAISSSRDLDSRSDVWACGVILHELLTARPLFASKNEYQTLMKVQRGDIMPPSTFNQGCPPELDAIVFKALARDPDDRFASALDMRDELTYVRQQYSLQTSHRDVARWLDWAFSLEPPSGFSGNTAEPVSELQMPTPRPRLRNADDEEAVEMVWGTAEDDRPEAGPIVLDDVPDVSEKHIMRAETFTTDSHDDVHSVDSVGDIPAHEPSHGSRPRGTGPIRAQSELPRARTSNPPPTSAARDSGLSHDDLFGLNDLDDAGETPAQRRAPTMEPVVRFSKSQAMAAVRPPSPSAFDEIPQRSMIPRTRPGVAPATVRKTGALTVAPASVIGQSMVARNQPARRWPLVVGLVALAGAGAAIAVLATSSTHAAIKPVSQPVATGPATVKFDVTPSDAELRIDGNVHNGSPWSTELAAGVHEIEIHRSGFTAYLTSLDLSPNDKHSLHIELRPLGTTGATTEATLSVSTTPSGLEAELDGVTLPQHTPIKMQVKIGSHLIVVKKAGVEVWRQRVDAAAASEYEFNPSFVGPPIVSPPGSSAPPAAEKKPESTTITEEKIEPTKPDPQQEVQPVPMPIAPNVPAPPPAPVMPTGPVTVPPNAVTKVSGDAVNITKLRAQNLPAVAAAKLCIDVGGAVTSVDFVTKLDKQLAGTLSDQLRTWKYKPYVRAGTPIGACFVVTMRMK
jgi:serine/threonine protein kinase